MNQTFVLSFDKVSNQINDIEYLSINTENLIAFPLMGNAEAQENAKRNIFSIFTKLLPLNVMAKPIQLVLFLDKNHIQTCNRGVFYFDDETILPVRFKASDLLNTWRIELLRNVYGTFYFTINQWSCKGHICDVSSQSYHPFDEMASWIFKLAPKEYKGSGDACLKANFLERFKNLNVSQATVDLVKLEQQWEELLTLEDIDCNARLSDASVYDTFQKETGLAFPEELKVILNISNGINEFMNGSEFLSGSKVLEEWKNWRAIYQSSNYMDLVDEYQYKGRSEKIVPMYVNPFRIPFIHDGGGNFIGIDMLPNWAGKIGQIIAFGVDEMAIRCIASDMNDFLQQFLDGKNPMDNDKLAKRAGVK